MQSPIRRPYGTERSIFIEDHHVFVNEAALSPGDRLDDCRCGRGRGDAIGSAVAAENEMTRHLDGRDASEPETRGRCILHMR